MRPVCVGIGGGSGSGKSWLAGQVRKRLGARAVVVCQDWYYKDNGHLSDKEALKLNFDHPKSFETSLLLSQLKDLREGRTVKTPRYDYARHARLKDTVPLAPSPVIILEGLLVLHDPRLRAMMDLSVFIDVPADVRLIRRVRRDVEHRRVDLEETLRLYEHCVRPMHDRFIQPTAEHATWVWKQLESRRFPDQFAKAVEALALGSNGSRVVGVSGQVERQRQRQPL
jgi:uridine kinase